MNTWLIAIFIHYKNKSTVMNFKHAYKHSKHFIFIKEVFWQPNTPYVVVLCKVTNRNFYSVNSKSIEDVHIFEEDVTDIISILPF